MLEERALDPAIHDRLNFECGVPALDDYIRRFAEQHRRRGLNSVYVLVDSTRLEFILGYYTLGAAKVDVERLPAAERKRLPRFPVPCFRMGRLACRSDQRGLGLGKLLVACAVDRCLKARQRVGAYALLVDARDDAVKASCLHFGFTPLTDLKLTLYLPLGARSASV